MLSLVRHWVMMPVVAAGAGAVAVVTGTQPGPHDGIGELLKAYRMEGRGLFKNAA
jgi:hypothetical protein